MKNNMLGVFLLFLLGLSTGCATAPTQQQINAADYGELKAIDSYQNQIIANLHEDLIDPYSATFANWKGPKKMWTNVGSGAFPEYVFGYQICVDVNAKNRMGGYIGTEPFRFFFSGDGRFFREGFSRPGTVMREQIYRKCND